MRAQQRGIGSGTSRHHVGNQPLVAAILARDHRRLRQARMPEQRRLDLARLDAEPAQLHLMVGAAEELQRPGGQEAGQVARAVESPSRLAAQAVGNESLGGQIRPAQVAAGHAGAADEQLSRQAGRHRPQAVVDQVEPPVGEGAPQGHHLLPRQELVRDHADRGLGGPIVVEDAALRRQLADPVDQGPGGGLAAQHQDLPRQHPSRVRRGEQVREVRRHDLETRDRVAAAVARESLGVRGPVLGEQVQATAAAQGREEGRVAEVRGRRGDQGVGGPGRQADPLRHGLPVARDLPVLDRDPLGLAGRSRGEEDVGQALRRHDPAGIGLRPASGLIPVAVERDHPGGERRGEPPTQRLPGDHDRRPGLAQDELQAEPRQARVERHVGAPRLEDRQQGDHQVRRAVEQDRHGSLGPYAEPGQVVGQLVGEGVELAVAQADVFADQRRPLRVARGPGLDLLVD